MRFILLFTALLSAAAAAELQIYAIDVEGGKSTLFVSPSGESMLVDAGYDGFNNRDANRILAAARAAGVRQIDYLVITHYHKDHAGGVPQLAAIIPIRHYLDHGPNFEATKDNGDVFSAYIAVRGKNPHAVLKPGDTVPIRGIDVKIVAAAGESISQPLPGAGQPNPACANYKALDADATENSRSIGMVVTYGAFRLVDLGDLHWNKEFDLACPVNKLGTVDVYMTTHHGKKTSGSPQMVWALHPKVAIMNNGPTSGGTVPAWQTIHDSPGLSDIWQLHTSATGGTGHNAGADFIANPSDPCEGAYIKLVVHTDATFTVTNSRNHFEKTYR